MNTKLAFICALAALVALPPIADAASKKRKHVKRRPVATEPRDYGSTTARQRANAEAFERGGYFEQIPDAHPFGSRSWWLLKEREQGGNMN